MLARKKCLARPSINGRVAREFHPSTLSTLDSHFKKVEKPLNLNLQVSLRIIVSPDHPALKRGSY